MPGDASFALSSTITENFKRDLYEEGEGSTKLNRGVVLSKVPVALQKKKINWMLLQLNASHHQPALDSILQPKNC